MAMLLSLLIISTLLLLVHSLGDEYQPTVENKGHSKIFSEDSIHLRCSVPEERSIWSYIWFRNNEKIADAEMRDYVSPGLMDSGSYSCLGWRKDVTGRLQTPMSLSTEITVNGGYVIMLVKWEPTLVGEALEAQCLVRGKPKLLEVFLYKDNVRVLSQRDNADLRIPNVNLTHQGTYTCKASWYQEGRLTYGTSPDTLVTVKDIVTEPILTVELTQTPRSTEITLRCNFEFNKRDPATQVHVYFYRNDKKLEGIAHSGNKLRKTVLNRPGWYRCKARVPTLNLVRWSQPTKHGEPADEQ